MRFFVFAVVFFVLGLNFVSAQKFGYIDSDFILGKMPDYKKAQDEIDQLSVSWQKEVEEMQKIVEGLYSSYQAEQVLLTEEDRKSTRLNSSHLARSRMPSSA